MDAFKEKLLDITDRDDRPWLDIAAVALVYVALSMLERGLGTSLEFLSVLPLTGTAVAVWFLLKRRQMGWRDFGLEAPDNVGSLAVAFIALAVVLLLFMRFGIPMIYGSLGGVPEVVRYTDLQGNMSLFIGGILAIWVSAAFAEELLFRGFIQNRLEDLLGGRGGWVVVALLQGVVVGLLHYNEQASSMVVFGSIGAIFGAFYYFGGRNLWHLILFHGLRDSMALTQIYLNGLPEG